MQKPTPKVKVIDSTCQSNEKTQAMIGTECHAIPADFAGDTYKVLSNYKEQHLFNDTDLQFLTPLEYNGVTVGIGDDVKSLGSWRNVYDFTWFNGKWRLLVIGAHDEYTEKSCSILECNGIENHRPLHPQLDTATKDAIKLLEDNGYKIVKK